MLNLFIFKHIEEDETISSLLRFRDEHREEDYYRAARGLIEFSARRLTEKDIIKEYILRTMLEQENIPDITTLRNFLRHDVKTIYTELLNYDWNGLFTSSGLIPMSDIETPAVPTGLAGYVQSLGAMMECESNEALGGAILAHAESFGTGIFAAYSALRWNKGSLTGIICPDDVSFADLTGLERQKNILITNTEQLLLGQGGSDINLTGDAGTGKSSCVKACLGMFKNSGLRLIEVGRNSICDLPEIYDCIKGDLLKYIIFIDGLDDSEKEVCKVLKSVFGSRAEARKKNVLVYATSAPDASEKVRASSLFGINLSFSSPTIDEYLNIVEDMLIDRGIPMTEGIRSAAVSVQHKGEGFSAAAAKQFVDGITGK